jgi:hypothetical protein
MISKTRINALWLMYDELDCPSEKLINAATEKGCLKELEFVSDWLRVEIRKAISLEQMFD